MLSYPVAVHGGRPGLGPLQVRQPEPERHRAGRNDNWKSPVATTRAYLDRVVYRFFD